MLPSIGDYTVRCRCGPPCVSFECLRPDFAKPRGNVYADGQRNASEMESPAAGRESSVSDQLVLGRRQFVDEDASTAFVVEDVLSSAESGDGGSAERPTGGGSGANGPAVNSAADGEETVARRTGRGRDRTTSNESAVAAAGTVRPGTARRAAAGDDEYADRSPPATRSGGGGGGGGREPSTPRAAGGRFTVDEAATADLRARSAGQPSTESSGTVADAEIAPPAEVGRRRRSAERPASRSRGDDARAAIYVDRPAQTGSSSGRLLPDDEDARPGSVRQRPEDEDGRFPMPWDDDSYRGGERIAECRCRCATSEVGFYRAICDCYEDDASSASQRRQRCDMRQWKCAAGSFAVAGRRPAPVTSSRLVVVDHGRIQGEGGPGGRPPLSRRTWRPPGPSRQGRLSPPKTLE